MAILTSRSPASGVTLNDLIHIVITSDQSQNPAGSSYKATIGQVFDSLSSYTFTNISISGDLNVSGNTTLNGLTANTISASTIIVDGVNLSGVTPNFIHKYTIFVDPNGDDDNGQFGNRNRPFRTLHKALSAAVDFMNGNDPMAMTNYDSSPIASVASLLGGGSIRYISYRYPYRIKIEVFPGLYNGRLSENFDSIPYNLLYNNIDWYFHPGAIVWNYIWTDGYFDVNDTELIPTYCNVYGKGTFINDDFSYIYSDSPTYDVFIGGYDSYGNPFQNNYITSGTTFNFEGESCNYSFNVQSGVVNVNFKHLFMQNFKKTSQNIYPKGPINFIPLQYNYHYIQGGTLNIKAEIAKWVMVKYPPFPFESLFISECESIGLNRYPIFIYQTGGNLDCNIGRYTGIEIPDGYIFNTQETPGPTPQIFETFSKMYSGGTSQYWNWRMFDESVENPGYPIGIFEEYTAKTQTRIQIDYGKIKLYSFDVRGGNIEFYPGKIEMYQEYGKFGVNPETIGGSRLYGSFFGFFNGVYQNTDSKFIIYDGIIKFMDIFESEGDFWTYSEALNIKNNPIVYIKGTQFVWEGQYYDIINAIAKYTGCLQLEPIGNQIGAIILDGAKFGVKSNDKTDIYLFYIKDFSPEILPEAVQEVRVYENVYSNFNDTSLTSPSSTYGVVNIIPTTNIILDPNVLLIGSDVRL